MAAVQPGTTDQPVDQGLRELRLAGPEIADDTDVELREPGVARVQMEELPRTRAEAFPDGEADPLPFAVPFAVPFGFEQRWQ